MYTGEIDIIVADDDADDVFFLEVAIQETGTPVILRHAKNATVLFELLSEKIPEFLFLDINMPCKDGIACITEIRQYKAYSRIPVVMYTANTLEHTIEQCYRNGANFYMVKELSLWDLQEKLKKIFSLDWKGTINSPPINDFVLWKFK